MSGRNRNIRLPIHTLTFNHPLPDADDDDCFGEEIRLDNVNFECDTRSDSLDSILCGIHDVNTDKSSSSTISWGVGDENETTMLLKNELERMEEVLTGQQPIPQDYDSNEYHRWLRYFPRFCIVGVPLKGLPKNHNNCEIIEEIIAVHPEEYQDPAIEDSPIAPDPIKETLIEHVYNKLSKLLLSPQSPQIGVDKPSNLTLNIDDYLKISPLPSTSLLPHRHRYHRGHSSKSLISSQTASAKWLKDDFTSLPFLNPMRDENRLFVRNEPKSILKTRFVLPPIDQFRSISATPRAATSTNLLAISGEQLNGGTRKSARRQTRRRFNKNKSYADE